MIVLQPWGRIWRTAPNGTQQRIASPGGLWKLLTSMASEIGASFDGVQAPPWSLTQSGTDASGDGYGLCDWFRLDGTFYGSEEELCQASAALAACGVELDGDLALHQFESVPAYFNAFCFRSPGCRDDVPDLANDNAFGMEVLYQFAPLNPITGNTITVEAARAYVRWVAARVGSTRFRLDDGKGINSKALRTIMDALSNATYFTEFFDGGNWPLAWSQSEPINGRCGVEDFMLYFRLTNACNSFDARLLEWGGAGLWTTSSNVVGFANNPDVDTTTGEQRVFNALLGYARLLMLPLHEVIVSGKDYFRSDVIPGGYGLKPQIDNLCWISRMFAIGAYKTLYFDQDVHISSRNGDGGSTWSGGLLTGLNFNVLSPRTVWVQTHWAHGTHLHDYTGHAGDLWVGPSGWVAVTVPSNAYSAGRSYVQYAPAGVNKSLPVTPAYVTQTIATTPYATKVKRLLTGSVTLQDGFYPAPGSTIDLGFKADVSEWTGNSHVFVEVWDPKGYPLSHVQYASSGVVDKHTVKAVSPGRHTINITSYALPASGSDFSVSMSYLGENP